MDRLNIRLAVLLKALNTVDEAECLMKEYATNHVLEKALRDSLIQRFEYCCESLWQCLKDFLIREYGVRVTTVRSIFEAAHRVSFISREELIILLKMVHNRNQTSHLYSEGISIKVSSFALECMVDIRKIVARLKDAIESLALIQY